MKRNGLKITGPSKKLNGYPQFDAKEIRLSFTKNPCLLNQYFYIAKEVYKNDLGLDGKFGDQDEFDELPNTRILLVRHKGECVGGLRLVFHEKHSDGLLPLEHPDFKLSEYFPMICKSGHTYAEVSRFVLKPDYRNSKLVKSLFLSVKEEVDNWQCNYLFSASPKRQSRVFRRLVQSMGHQFSTMKQIPIPERKEYGGLQLFLSVTGPILRRMVMAC